MVTIMSTKFNAKQKSKNLTSAQLGHSDKFDEKSKLDNELTAINKQMNTSMGMPAIMQAISNNLRGELAKYDKKQCDITTADCALAALAVFLFKWPSLLKYETYKDYPRVKTNLENLFKIKQAPCDTYIRTKLDAVKPDSFRPAYKELFSKLQRGKFLEQFTFYDGAYLLSVDGTQNFSSNNIHCNNCCQKHHKNGTITFHHNSVNAALTHPDVKQVIPFCPEEVQMQDGTEKNDYESAASKRLLKKIRDEHPHLKLIVTYDALAADAPMIKFLQSLCMNFIITAKETDLPYIFSAFDKMPEEERQTYQYTDDKGVNHSFSFVVDLPINKTNEDVLVNLVKYSYIDKNGITRCFAWITDIDVTTNNVNKIMQGGRCRWKIENETHNVLKNQGYEYERNYGHGQENLCSVFTSLMLLAFAIDQALELGCKLYQEMRILTKTYKSLWEDLRAAIKFFDINDWDMIYNIIINSSKPVEKARSP